PPRSTLVPYTTLFRSRLTVSALAAADGIVIPVTASVLGLHGLGGFRDWLAGFRPDRIITAPVWGVLLTQADLDAQGRMRTRVGRSEEHTSELQSRFDL